MSTAGARRRVVLVSVHTDLVRRDLVTSGVLTDLAGRYDLQFVVAPDVDTTEMRRLGSIAGTVRGGFGRGKLWHFLSILSAIRVWTPLSGSLGRTYFNRKKVDNYSWSIRFLVLANFIGIAPLMLRLGRFLLSFGAERALGLKEDDRPDAIVAPTGFRDFVADDLVRWGVGRRIPTLFLQLNSDVFNMKVPTSDAAYFGVWGDQSWYFARLVCRYPASRLKVIGSPRFETYAKHRVCKCEARRALGLRESDLVLLFGGATAAFDEPRALEQLDRAIGDGILPANLVVLYKPHPKGQVKDAITSIDLSRLSRVKVAPDSVPGTWSSPEIYPLLFAASDAVVSPYSTMGVEGALNGLPVLCLGYHPGRFESYWKWAREFTHLQIYRNKIWCVRCHTEAEFLPGVQTLVGLIGRPEVAEAARNEVRAVSLRDGRTYAERLAECLDEIVSEGEWRPAV